VLDKGRRAGGGRHGDKIARRREGFDPPPRQWGDRD
jgi:hypothetical protein